MSEILLCDADGVAQIVLNRPDRLNAYTPTMGVALFRALRDYDRRDDVRAIVITGSGRGFCAGADLAAQEETFAGRDTWAEAAALEAEVQPWRMSTPVICAINGPAVGVGATLPLSWDIRLASERARIGFVFVRRGITPEANSTWLLPRLVGMAKASELLLTGRIIDAEEALALGLVSRVVPHEALMGTALELAREIATHTAPVSVAITKRLLWRNVMNQDPISAKALEDELFAFCGASPDAAEGVVSFLEKRAPRWTMKLEDLPASIRDVDQTIGGG